MNDCRQCATLSVFFQAKIDSFKQYIALTLSSSTPLPYLHDFAFTGHHLTHVPPITVAEVVSILKSIPSKSSPMDFIATSLIKSCHGAFSELISRLVNFSFNEGQFPSRFKTPQITPLLKKTGLDKPSPENHRPISHLNDISKILGRLLPNRIRSHVLLQFQSILVSLLLQALY